MPKGNDQKPGQQASISIFLKSAEAKVLPPSILPKASFKLSIINHVNPEGHVEKGMHDRIPQLCQQVPTTMLAVHPSRLQVSLLHVDWRAQLVICNVMNAFGLPRSEL